MTKSFLIKTSVAAIVSAFVFTAGVSSARAWGDSYREASSNRGPLYYPNRDTGGNHVSHYPKRHSRSPYNSYGSYGGNVGHYAKPHSLRIPIYSGRVFQLEAGHRSDLKPSTIPK